MDRDTKIALLRRKVELVAANTYDEKNEEFIRKFFSKFLDHATRFPRMPESSFKDMDRELERMMSHHVLRADHDEVRVPLIKEFGTSRLAVSSKAIVQRVLKRGCIQSEEEYYEIQDIVTNVDNIDRLGEATYTKLDALAGSFRPTEKRSTPKQKSPKPALAAEQEIPRWPMVPPEGDEKLCPQSVSLDVMEKFIRTKLELLCKRYDNAEEKAQLKQCIEWGFERVHGPATPSDRKDFSMRYLEHELEFFSGNDVTMDQLRTVEDTLQSEFGFRRLLPSPRQLGLKAIAEGTPREMFVKVIIERALYNYTAPSIFSADEAKRIRQVLKSKPSNAT